MKSEDWIGFRQGQLTVTSFDGLHKFEGGGKAACYTFRCDCGIEFSAQKSNVIGRGRMDCGHSVVKQGSAPPGSTAHPIHKVWWHMINRCRNPKNRSFKDYGARGIAVCDRWRLGENGQTGFECFLADMGPRPKGNYTIERIHNNGNYEPQNCTWLHKSAQARNTRRVRHIRIGDRTQTIPEWCAETGVGYWTAIRRIYRGWTPVRAVTESAQFTPRWHSPG